MQGWNIRDYKKKKAHRYLNFWYPIYSDRIIKISIHSRRKQIFEFQIETKKKKSNFNSKLEYFLIEIQKKKEKLQNISGDYI